MGGGLWFRRFRVRSGDSSPPPVLRPLIGSKVSPGPEPGTGIVLFDTVTPALTDFVAAACASGCDRLVALAERPTAPTEIGHLVEAGAAEVLPLALVTRSPEVLTARVDRWRRIDALVRSPDTSARLVGASAAWRRALAQAAEAASNLRAGVLLTGESGTGKELIARFIHDVGADGAKRPFEIVDCTTIVPDLAGSELFGHERGAFTGAHSAREGAVERADRGTLFLDEIGDLPAALQPQLLRVLQEGTYRRVGGNRWQSASFRLIAATHRDLGERVQRGRFRADLFYRIAAIPLRLPPLRERPEDIPVLIRHFVEEAAAPSPAPELDPAVAALLAARSYPGNVRELRQLVLRIMHRWPGVGPLTVGCVPEEEWLPHCADGRAREEVAGGGAAGSGALERAVRRRLFDGMGLREIGRSAEDMAIRVAMDAEAGNLRRAARRLGVTDRALQLRRQQARQQGGGDC